jgi:chemotaxis signal transduction protein
MIRDAVLAARSSDGVLSRWVGFTLAGQQYAVDIRKVQEVVVAPDIEPVPRAPSAVRGVINLRGRIVTVIDLGRCLGFPAAADGAPCTVVVTDAAGETLGLCVDGVAEICSVAESAIKPMPPIHGQRPDPLVRGMVRRGGLMLILLDLDQLAPAAA